MIKTNVDQQILFIRGDTFSFGMELLTEPAGAAFTVDSVTFTARKGWAEAIAFQCTLNDGIEHLEGNNYRVRIAPEKTRTLTPGRYVYDLQLTHGNDVITPLRGNLLLAEDATY